MKKFSHLFLEFYAMIQLVIYQLFVEKLQIIMHKQPLAHVAESVTKQFLKKYNPANNS